MFLLAQQSSARTKYPNETPKGSIQLAPSAADSDHNHGAGDVPGQKWLHMRWARYFLGVPTVARGHRRRRLSAGGGRSSSSGFGEQMINVE